MSSFSSPCIGMCTTEDISDKPSEKYGVILIIKGNNNRIGAICFCTDGTTYTNNYNASTSSLNGWIQIQLSLNDECDSIKQSFQDGCNIIINKIQSIGVTPSSNSPTAIANAIQEIRDGSLEAGRQQVTGNPNKYNLFTAEQYNQNYNNGRTQGQNDVKGNPNAYGLYSKSQYDNHYNEGYNAGYNAGVSAGQGSVAGSYNISFTINARGGNNGSNWMKYTDQITINVSKSGVPTLGSPSFMNAQIRSEYGESYRLTKK